MRLVGPCIVLMESTYQRHVLRRFSDFLMASPFFNSNNCSLSVLAKNWWLCTQLAASACKIYFHVAMSSKVPVHFPNLQSNQRAFSWKVGSMVENVDLPLLKKYKYDVKLAFCILLSACLLSCNRVAASCMQIVPAWMPVACKFPPILSMLHVTGGHAGTICMRLTATRLQIICNWPPVVCKFCMR